LTIFADTWEKLNQSPYYSNIITKNFDSVLALSPISDPKQIENMVFKILNTAYEEFNLIPPYPTWPFPKAFFKSMEGQFPRQILNQVNDYLMDCKRRKKVLEWPGDDSPIISVSSKVHERFTQLIANTNVEQFKDKNEEILFWHKGLIAFAKCIEAENKNLPNGYYFELEYIKKINLKKPFAYVKIILSDKNGSHGQTLSIWANLQDKARAFQSRLKEAITSSGLNIKRKDLKLALIHFANHPKGKVTQDLWDKFCNQGGIDSRPENKEIAHIYAIKTILEEFPEHEWTEWASNEKPTQYSEFLRTEMASLFNL
jgi:hypothetical protein